MEIRNFVSNRTIKNVKAALKVSTGGMVVFGSWTDLVSQMARVEVKDFWINHADGDTSLNDCFAQVVAL